MKPQMIFLLLFEKSLARDSKTASVQNIFRRSARVRMVSLAERFRRDRQAVLEASFSDIILLNDVEASSSSSDSSIVIATVPVEHCMICLESTTDIVRSVEKHRATMEENRPTVDIDLYEEDVGRCAACPAVYCYPCFREYIRHKVMNGEVRTNQLVCPGACRLPLTKRTLRNNMADATFQKYLDFIELQQQVLQGARYCPRPDCGHVLPTTSSKSPPPRRVFCGACEKESCFNCGQDYHPFPACGDRNYRSWCRNNHVQTCPNCTWAIEKNGGCKHMTCTRCSFEFCWYCHQDWASHNKVKCLPLAYIKSKHKYFGRTAPVRVVTKTVFAGVAAGAVVVGAGVVLAVLPPVFLWHCGVYVKDKITGRG
ncbi:Aste57867_23027 [Aphanomyces stellatus]|uniref:RBR-type E3 ubiquitin transferase n=1 Tax=Aphanomyces stellatus TaxID=120398 RepID=A0A485LLM5_9STRA|nr:hypothetical protein As57867_022956 [Aphanomyces stellatus]VFT99675.1 Aste57867_23027 [Aphanomyces stellatus]